MVVLFIFSPPQNLTLTLVKYGLIYWTVPDDALQSLAVVLLNEDIFKLPRDYTYDSGTELLALGYDARFICIYFFRLQDRS